MTSSKSVQGAFNRGVAAFQGRQFDKAWEILSELNHPQAQNLAGYSAQKLGRMQEAEAAYERAAVLSPGDPNITNNRGHFALEQGDLGLAETFFDAALTKAPDMVAARIGKAKVAAARKNWYAAATLWRNVLAANPASREGRFGLATAQLEMGHAADALTLFAELQAESDQPAIAFMLGRALLDLGEFDEAAREVEKAHSAAPGPHTLRTLANLAWMKGDLNAFDSLLATARGDMAVIAARLVLESGDAVRANAMLQAQLNKTRPNIEAWILASQIGREINDGARALEAAEQAALIDPTDVGALDALIVSQLMQGKVDAALEHIAALRARDPFNQLWIAHESTAQRLKGNSAVGGLNDADRFVRTYSLDLPVGYDTLEAFNADLLTSLRHLHTLAARPLGQSLRGNGSQTAMDLRESDDPVIRTYLRALDTTIRRYLDDIGQAPGHPTSARNRLDYVFRGVWSVRLTDAGYHAAHVHPQGWISSAYYVAVPRGETRGLDKAGWINFGKPPYATTPTLEPLRWVEPRAGLLALFPSYIWHGTEPTTEGTERVTAPFDILPA